MTHGGTQLAVAGTIYATRVVDRMINLTVNLMVNLMINRNSPAR